MTEDYEFRSYVYATAQPVLIHETVAGWVFVNRDGDKIILYNESRGMFGGFGRDYIRPVIDADVRSVRVMLEKLTTSG